MQSTVLHTSQKDSCSASKPGLVFYQTSFKIVNIDHRISGNLIRDDIYSLIKRTFLIFTGKKREKKVEIKKGIDVEVHKFINPTIIYWFVLYVSFYSRPW